MRANLSFLRRRESTQRIKFTMKLIAIQVINTPARIIFDAKPSGFAYSLGKRQDLTPFYEAFVLRL